MMKKLLYVNGCSHSCGSELSHKESFRTLYDLENAWSGILSKKFNLKQYNDAISGQSNKAIYSNTVNSILKLLKEYDSSEIFVIIGWTSYERTEVLYENKIYRFLPGIVDFDWFKRWPREVQSSFKNWALCMDMFNTPVNDFSLTYYSMKTFLDLNKIDYYFFNAIHYMYHPRNNLLHQLDSNDYNRHLFDILQNDDKFLDPFDKNMTYTNYLIERYDPFDGGRNYHFREKAQIEWASILEKEIENIYGNSLYNV